MNIKKRKKILKKISFQETNDPNIKAEEGISLIDFPDVGTKTLQPINDPNIIESESVPEPASVVQPEILEEEKITAIPEESENVSSAFIDSDFKKLFNEIFFEATSDFIKDKIQSNEMDAEIALSGLEEIKKALQVTQTDSGQELLAAASKKIN
jgi:hypothetical protein